MLEDLPVSVVAVPSQFVYANISGATLQSLVEWVCPNWLVHSSYGEAYGVVDALNTGQLSGLGSKNSINILNHSSVGNLHRWKLRGHDLGLDIPEIFVDVQENEYELLAPLAAKMFIANTKRQLKYMKPSVFNDETTDEEWYNNFYEPLRIGRVPGEVLDFQIVYPLSLEEEKKAWEKSKLEAVKEFMLKQL